MIVRPMATKHAPERTLILNSVRAQQCSRCDCKACVASIYTPGKPGRVDSGPEWLCWDCAHSGILYDPEVRRLDHVWMQIDRAMGHPVSRTTIPLPKNKRPVQ